MLNIGSQGQGSFNPWVKYNSKSGRWSRKVEGGEQEIPDPTFVADLANIKTGWLKFAAGMAPSKVFDPELGKEALRPDSDHKRGFEVVLFSKQAFGGIAELASNSMHLCGAINELYGAYQDGLKDNAGKLPVVQCTGSTPQKDKHGTNYKPAFKILKWVDRPAELAGSAAANVQLAPTPTPVVVSSVESEF